MQKGIVEAQNIMIEYAAQISHVMGVSDGVARIVALLYMSPSSLSIPVICERLSLTKGTVSIYLRLLEERGAILLSRTPQGSRQKFYEINPHLWRDLARDMKRRHRKRLEITGEAVEKSLNALKEHDETCSAEDRLAEKLLTERIERFRMISLMTGRLIEQFFGNGDDYGDCDSDKITIEKEKVRRVKIE